jgi:addiction module HigA family antidote
MPRSRVSGILNGKRSITAETALALGFYFGNSPEFWLNLQNHYDLERATRESFRNI